MQKNKDRSVPRSYLDNLSNCLFYRHLKISGGSMQQEKKAMICDAGAMLYQLGYVQMQHARCSWVQLGSG